MFRPARRPGAPTVVALRAKAAEVVEAELARLAGRLGPLDERARRRSSGRCSRVVDKLLHAPTVRVKELAGSPGGDSYEAALRVLFDLDPGRGRGSHQGRCGPAPWAVADVPRPPLRLGTRKSPMAMTQSGDRGQPDHRAHRGSRSSWSG